MVFAGFSLSEYMLFFFEYMLLEETEYLNTPFASGIAPYFVSSARFSPLFQLPGIIFPNHFSNSITFYPNI